MNYPIEILPNPKRKLISCDISNKFLIRSTLTNITSELIDESTEEVKQSVICSPKEQVIDLSASILGIFNFEHNCIDLTTIGKSKYKYYCAPDQEVEPPVHETDFEFVATKGFLILLIDKIHNQLVEYYFGDKPDKIFLAKCSVIHTPTLWNYWHYSVKWHLIEYNCFLDEIKDEKLKNKISRRLSTDARALIAKFAKIKKVDIDALDTSCYEK